MKKFIYVACALIVLGLLGYASYKGFTKDSGGKQKIRIAYNNTSFTNVSIIIAYEKGYFVDQNIDPEMIPLKGGKEVRQAIVANQADLGPGSFPNFMAPMEEGAPIRFIASTASFSDYLIVRPDSNIKKFTDLYGKNVSVSPQGMDDLAFRSAMEKENVDVNKMKFTDIERSVLPTALMKQKVVDAVVVSKQDTESLYEAGAVILPEWEEKGYDKVMVPRSSIAINTSFLNQNEKIVDSFLNAIIEAHRFMKNNPQEAATILADHIRKGTEGAVDYKPETIIAQWQNKEIVNMIWSDTAETMKSAKIANDIGATKRELSLTDVFDLRFQNKLEKAQNEIYGN